MTLAPAAKEVAVLTPHPQALSSPRIAPFTEDAEANIRKDEAGVWSMRPTGSVIDRPPETHA